jgi:IS5 family transposase
MNAAKSRIRSRIEHVFAEQKDRMDLFIRTIGLPRAATKIGLANLFAAMHLNANLPVAQVVEVGLEVEI